MIRGRSPQIGAGGHPKVSARARMKGRPDILVYLCKGVVCVQMFVCPSCFLSHSTWAIWKFLGPFGDIVVSKESRGPV